MKSGLSQHGAPLSPREREIVRLVRQGRRNRAIAEELGLSQATVKRHLHYYVFCKTGVVSRAELAIRANEWID